MVLRMYHIYRDVYKRSSGGWFYKASTQKCWSVLNDCLLNQTMSYVCLKNTTISQSKANIAKRNFCSYVLAYKYLVVYNLDKSKSTFENNGIT